MIGAPTDPRDKHQYSLQMTLVRVIVTALVRSIFPFISDQKRSGMENLPSSGPVILAANHLTNFDVFPMQLALTRPLFFMGKEELFKNPVQSWLIRQLGAFPVRRGGGDEWALRYAARVLEHGQVLAMFPEGKRSKENGLREAKTGVARLAIQANCPIAPMAVSGTQYMFRRFPARTQVSISLAEPIYPKQGETPLELTERVMLAIASMLPPDARGVYTHRVAETTSSYPPIAASMWGTTEATQN